MSSSAVSSSASMGAPAAILPRSGTVGEWACAGADVALCEPECADLAAAALARPDEDVEDVEDVDDEDDRPPPSFEAAGIMPRRSRSLSTASSSRMTA